MQRRDSGLCGKKVESHLSGESESKTERWKERTNTIQGVDRDYKREVYAKITKNRIDTTAKNINLEFQAFLNKFSILNSELSTECVLHVFLQYFTWLTAQDII